MSESISEVVSGTAPSLVGVWVYDPTDPDATDRNFRYASGRVESVRPRSAVLEVVGRGRPIVEFGELMTQAIKLTVLVPFDDEHDDGVQWWRDAVDNRRTIIYRDNRGRMIPVALPEGVELTDGRIGTAFALSLLSVDYTPEV